MQTNPRLARQLAPFGATALLGFALVPIANDVNWTSYALAAALTVAVAALAILGSALKLPRPMRMVPPLLFLVAVALLRNAGGGSEAGVGALALLPVFWIALHGTRAELLVMTACVSALIAAPVVLDAVPEYPLGSWRVAVVFGAAAAIVAITVQNLVARVRDHADALALRERDLEAITDLSRSLLGSTDARERICTATCDLSGAQFAVLLEAEDDGTLGWSAGAGMSLTPATFTPRRESSWAMAAYSTRVAQFVADPGRHPNTQPELFEATGRPAALLFEPVCRGDEAVGVLIAGWREAPADSRRTTGLVRLLASEAAFAIERADLLGQLTEMAHTDMLTGLPNRRAWEDRLGRALRDQEPICVAILDLDHFKSYNDDHGHQSGDRLLKETAAAWRAELRSTDMLARYGGEEFVVLLPGADVEAARRVVERLRAATPRGQSSSAGIACREPGEDAAALLARADDALYEAKRSGRDRSLIAVV